MATDLDRRCAKERQERKAEIDYNLSRIDEIKCRYRHCTNSSRNRLTAIIKYTESLIIELYQLERIHDSYDKRLRDAFDDPTGQDLDVFAEEYGEGDDPHYEY